MNRVQVLQMLLQVLQLLVTMMLLTVELRRLGEKAREARNLHGAGGEPPAMPGHHMFIPVLPPPRAPQSWLWPGAPFPWTAHSPTSSPPIVLAASR